MICQIIIIIIIIRREVETNDGQHFADELKMEFFETSAKTGKNAEIIFKRIAEKVLYKIENKQINLSEQVN
jgi:Ras-related protein Rab-2A